MADVRQFSDAEINRLVKFYEQAEREILDRINRALLRANKTEYLVQMKREIEAILQQLREGNRTWCTEAIPRVYSQGLYSADAMLKDTGTTGKAGFGAIHQQAAQVLAENAYQRFEDVVQVIGRQGNDIYRELALENVRGTVVGYDTWKQTAKRYREQLAERGVTGFKDRSGKMWNMRTYTEMVARTTTMEAHLQGTVNRLVEQGHDLVKVSTHRGACELCVVPETLVSGPIAQAAIRRKYCGDIINIRTSSGNKLSGTPDHSVLTVNGWRRLQELTPGDKVITNNGGQWGQGFKACVVPNNIQMPSTIEDVFESFLPPFGYNVFVSPSGGEFDSNIINSEVDIVIPDSSLLAKLYSALKQPLNNLLLIERIRFSSASFSQSDFAFGIPGMVLTSPGFMGSSYQHFLLLGSQCSPTLPLRRGPLKVELFGIHSIESGLKVIVTRPDRDVCTSQIVSNGGFAYSKDIANFSRCFARHIKFDNFFDLFFIESSMSFAAREQFDSMAHKNTLSLGVADMEGGHELLKRLAGLVSPDEIVDINISRYCGHVYDLHTVPNWYITNNIISHNCTPWQGKILSITGKTKGYPTLEEAKAAKLFHPRCRHAYGLYIDLDKEIEELEAELNLSPEEEKNYIEIEGLSKPAKTGLAKALTEALQHGYKTGTECLLHIDKNTGKSVYSKVEGTTNEVVYPQPLIDFLDNAALNSVIQIHNHPGSSSFSSDDLKVLSNYKSISHIAVIGHDGRRYIAKVGQGLRPTSKEISLEWKAAHDKHFNYFNNKVGRGELSPEDAWKAHSHLIIEEVAEKFGWEYRRVMPNEK